MTGFPSATFADRIAKSFERQAAMRLIGAELTRVEHGTVEIELPFDDKLTQQHGFLHAGVISAALDTACGYAGVFCDEPGARRATVTLTLSVNFVAAVNAGRLSVAARRTGGGRSIFFADATVHDGEGRLIATASGSFKYLADPPPAR